MKRTLKRESEELEVVESNPIVTSNGELVEHLGPGVFSPSGEGDGGQTLFPSL
jgi:hypothetical protein